MKDKHSENKRRLRRPSDLNRFVLKTAIGAIPVMLLFGCTVYYILSVRDTLSGDLGRLGKIGFSSDYTYEMHRDRLPRCMVHDITESDSCARIITIGDSFSQMGIIGYANYLGDKVGEEVVNIPSKVYHGNDDPVQGAYDVLQSGFFDGKNVEWVILQSVERTLPGRCLNFEKNKPKAEDLIRCNEPSQDEVNGEKAVALGFQNYLSRMNKQATDWLRVKVGLDKNPVRHLSLCKELFSIDGHRSELYFVRDDLYMTSMDEETIAKIYQVLSFIHDEYAKHGIKLLVLVCADKYDVYQDFAVGNNCPRKEVGKQLKVMDRTGYFINTMPIIKQRVCDGELDMYMANDTHWSYKSSALVADTLATKIIAR